MMAQRRPGGKEAPETNREAIDFGHSVGIDLFQGRYVEGLIAEDGRRREFLKLKRRIERSEADAYLDEE